MPTIAQRPLRLASRAPHRLTVWLLGAVLVAAVAIILGLSLTGSGAHQTGASVDAPGATPQAPTPFSGAHP